MQEYRKYYLIKKTCAVYELRIDCKGRSNSAETEMQAQVEL